MKLTDESPMPFGKFKGTKLANVPASYLKWIYDSGLNPGSLREYITDNIDALNLELYKENKKR